MEPTAPDSDTVRFGKAIAMKNLLALALLPLFLTNCMVMEFATQQGNGIPITEVRDLATFSRVQLDCPMHVTIKSGSEYAAYVTSDENLSQYIQTDAFAGVLTIDLAMDIDPVIEPEIVIVMPRIRSVVHNGNGLVEIQEGGDFPDLKLQLNGLGEIMFSGTATNLSAELNGSGQIILDGFASLITADLRGSGAIHAENLLVEDADVNLSGSGNVYLDLDYQSTLNLDLTGSGKVEWWGAPQKLNYNLLGIGKVVEHRGLPKRSANAKRSASSLKSAAVGAYDSAGPLAK